MSTQRSVFHRILRKSLFFMALAIFSSPGNAQMNMPGMEGTSTDLFLMAGADSMRPGGAQRVNLNVGIGHTFRFLKKNPFGDEITFGYTYENMGTHGFFHSEMGGHTTALGLMKNFSIAKSKRFGGYTWLQEGMTSMTGMGMVQNRLYSGASLGLTIHVRGRNSIWVQETYNKMVTVPWYTTAMLGYTRSW